ncbi:MAG: RtcB family protein [Candidatus Micrarchaeota archaeon]|nr:RtcB family protein [Candidatus Micrarchaeota archaeon]MDE1848064.1 RtcB family protein [Candidatus Micrarchaeota archaeon]MDE1864618.1 RtcB family protein [Candidatus Micrarchaeota archaeon]
MELERFDDVRFDIKREQEKGMNASVRVYATSGMLEKMKQDRTLKQAVNASTLPGIVGKVMVMPDGHEGYGFPVGGVVGFDAEEGIISPGAIGFDINCLTPDTKVLDEDGAWHSISDMLDIRHRLMSFGLDDKKLIKADGLLFMKKEWKNHVLVIKTKFGKEIVATPDHPLLTDRGMLLSARLSKGDLLVSSGFEGIEFVRPRQERILTEEMLRETLASFGTSDKGNGTIQVLNRLRKLNLNVVDLQHQKLPILIKLLGFVFGDGTIPNIKHGVHYTTFYGKLEDLVEVKKDIQRLGFKSAIHIRKRHHKIKTFYDTIEFDFIEHSLSVNSRGFSSLLVTLGAPLGKKAAKAYRIPEWVMNSENWQKRLFLAAYFGAELSTPSVINGYNFKMPSFSVNKLRSLGDNAIAFLKDIKTMLESLGVATSEPSVVEGYSYKGVHGESTGFRLSIMSNTENLIRFFGTVGYVYNHEKERKASIACAYLRYLEGIRGERNLARQTSIQMHTAGLSKKAIIGRLASGNVSEGFIEHSIFGRTGKARIYGSLKLEEFAEKFEVGKSGLVYDGVSSIEQVPYSGEVFDLTMDDPNHNFIANGIVVSNCGVRLIKTDLTEKEVRPKLEMLMDRLFANVPSGVGSKLKLGFTQEDVKKVAEEGVGYAIGKGFGFEEDIKRIEENGMIAGADIEKVSQAARKRGMQALGTLGAGNHFLEVQKIDSILNERIAKAYGLYEDQVVVMVHTGSRGFGHQVCSDYLKILVEYQQKNNIKIVDPELSYAKIGSKEADDYIGAMNCAVNFAFTNRQIITNSIRKSFEETFAKSADALGMDLLYDVAHNIAKREEHVFEGRKVSVYVHRKGATRAFSKGREEIPRIYRSVGQPVIIPGSMGTASYVLCGKEGAMDETFGSTCHGSGRLMSRHQAIRDIPQEKTFGDLERKKISIRVRTKQLISEEAEWAYKNVDDVVGVVEKAGISDIVSRNVPLGVAKG